MLSNHLKKGLWLWIAACVALWVASRQTQFQLYADQMGRAGTLGLWAGTSILLIALPIVSHIERSRSGRRLTELHQRVQAGETVEIHGGSGLIRLIVLLAVAGIILLSASSHAGWEAYSLRQTLFAGGVVILTALEMLTVLPLLMPRPILRISRDTLESPVFGKLSWRDIDGFEIDEREIRGITVHYRLRLLVHCLPNLVHQMPVATRLKQHIRSTFHPSTELQLRLLRPSEMPKVILTLCKRIGSEHRNSLDRHTCSERKLVSCETNFGK